MEIYFFGFTGMKDLHYGGGGVAVRATLEEQPRLTDLWLEEAVPGVSAAPPISTVRLPV